MNNKPKEQKRKRKGFTLVELIVVIAVLLILSVVAVVAYTGIQADARRAALKSDSAVVVSSLNMRNSYATSTAGYSSWPTTSGNVILITLGADESVTKKPVDYSVQVSAINVEKILNGGSERTITYADRGWMVNEGSSHFND